MHQLFGAKRERKSAVARQLGSDIKTVRRCLRQSESQLYRRPSPVMQVGSPFSFLKQEAGDFQ